MAKKKLVLGILAPARKPLKVTKTIKTKTTTKTTYTEGDGGARTGLHVHVLIDVTQSMEIVRDSTISAVNEYLSTLVPEEVPTTVTLQLFHSPSQGLRKRELCVRQSPQNATRLNRTNYAPSGMTPLRDAIGTSIAEIDALGLPPSHGVVLVIQTDGGENQSREYSQEAIRLMIEERRRRGWMVTFLAANQDAVLVGNTYGIGAQNSMTYGVGNERAAMASSARSTRFYASGQSAEASGFTDEERKKATL